MPISSSGRRVAVVAILVAGVGLAAVLHHSGSQNSYAAIAPAAGAELPDHLPRMTKDATKIARKWKSDAVLTGIDIDESSDFAPSFTFWSASEQSGLSVVSNGGTLTPMPVSSGTNMATAPLPAEYIDLPEAMKAAEKQGMAPKIKDAALSVDDGKAVWTLQAAEVQESGDPQNPPKYLYTIDAVTGGAPVAQAAADSSEEQAKNGPASDNTMAWMTAPKEAAKRSAYTDRANDAYDRKDYADALRLYLQAAHASDPRAMTVLGNMYHDGQAVPKDPAKAVEWYKQAAELGNRGGQFDLAEAYEEGDGIAPDEAAAAHWYTESARQGFPDAQFALGLSYEFGEGVPRNRRTAIYWLDKVAAQGDGRAKWYADWLSRPDTPQFKDEAAFGQYISGKVSAKVWREMAVGNAAPLPHGDGEVYDRQQKAEYIDQMGDHEGAIRCSVGGRC